MTDKTDRQHWLTVARVLAFCYVQKLTSLCRRFQELWGGLGTFFVGQKEISPPISTREAFSGMFHFTRSFNPGILIQFTFPSLLSYIWYISRYNCKNLGNLSHNHCLAFFLHFPSVSQNDCQTEAAFAQFSLSRQEWHPFEFISFKIRSRYIWEDQDSNWKILFFFLTPPTSELQVTRPGLPWEYFAPTFARGTICLSAHLSFSGKGDIQNEFHLRCAFEAFRNTLY